MSPTLEPIPTKSAAAEAHDSRPPPVHLGEHIERTEYADGRVEERELYTVLNVPHPYKHYTIYIEQLVQRIRSSGKIAEGGEDIAIAFGPEALEERADVARAMAACGLNVGHLELASPNMFDQLTIDRPGRILLDGSAESRRLIYRISEKSGDRIAINGVELEVERILLVENGAAFGEPMALVEIRYHEVAGAQADREPQSAELPRAFAIPAAEILPMEHVDVAAAAPIASTIALQERNAEPVADAYDIALEIPAAVPAPERQDAAIPHWAGEITTVPKPQPLAPELIVEQRTRPFARPIGSASPRAIPVNTPELLVDPIDAVQPTEIPMNAIAIEVVRPAEVTEQLSIPSRQPRALQTPGVEIDIAAPQANSDQLPALAHEIRSEPESAAASPAPQTVEREALLLGDDMGADPLDDRNGGGTRGEDLLYAQRLKLIDVVLRNYATAEDHDVRRILRLQQLEDLWKESHMSAGENAHPDTVNILLDRAANDHLGGLVEPGVDHLHPRIAESTRDDLSTPVMAI